LTPQWGIGGCWSGAIAVTVNWAYYRCYAPDQVALTVLVRVAGRRWTIEEPFQASMGQTGLDEHQVRTWISWYRWTTLVLLAYLFLAITTVTARASPPGQADFLDVQRNPPPCISPPSNAWLRALNQTNLRSSYVGLPIFPYGLPAILLTRPVRGPGR
jgi:hypothetical protein